MISKRRRLTEVLRPSRFVPARPLTRTRSAGICSTHDHFPLPLSNSADTANDRHSEERRSTIEFEIEDVQNGRYIWDFQSAAPLSCPKTADLLITPERR
jgi:hypothetical protein